MQILGLAKRVFHSPLLRDDMKKLCVKFKIDYVVLMRAVPTRWNSVAMALKRALVLQPAIDKLVTMDQHNTSRGPKLKKYQLSKNEWDILKQLSPLLQRFLAATERISKSAVPLVHEVIPLIDSLTDTLAAAVIDEALHPVVRAAMARGVEVLNKYYSKTDDSIMYRLAMRTSFSCK
ncbi:hypothetical protein BD410DRAFT_733533 [Rickenella mellea]|uniref:Uncharacterized protein n=1 Tax=Rickenella mellea TaxID=50990 RepID=A0A4Y7PK98_9AGAM|nr:hypothetical protein BD410DRAFT_733533 [Rickenella mellea]